MKTSGQRAARGVVRDKRGRTIGHITGDAYYKLVTQPDQILRAPAGYGFDAWAMETQVLPVVTWIVVDNRCDGRLYRCRADDFLRSCLTIDRGAGRQYVLPLTYWREAQAPLLPEHHETSASDAPRQGCLPL